jgi:lipid A 3-O-deacylase
VKKILGIVGAFLTVMPLNMPAQVGGVDIDGQLRGHVQTQGNLSVANAEILIRLDGKEIARAKSNIGGNFLFSGPDHDYEVSVQALGFDPLHLDAVAFAHTSVPTLLWIAKPPDPSRVHQAANANWEYGVLFQGGVGLEERTDFSFIMAGAHLGKVITPELGTGLFKGNFEYAVEVLPLWQSYTPTFQRLSCPVGATLASQCRQTTTGGTYRGASITPIMLRWNLTHGTRFMPWVQAAGGVLYTTRKYPGVGDLNPLDSTQTGPAADTSVWNFTPQGGVGAHYFIKPKRSVDMSVNAVHISSASLGDKNPGVNISLQMSIGYSWWK